VRHPIQNPMVPETKPGNWRSKASTSTFCAGPISISRALKGRPKRGLRRAASSSLLRKHSTLYAISALIPLCGAVCLPGLTD
jgi:hypothetical protein